MANNINSTKFANAKVGDKFLFQHDNTVWVINEIDQLDGIPIYARCISEEYDEEEGELDDWFTIRELQHCVLLPTHNAMIE